MIQTILYELCNLYNKKGDCAVAAAITYGLDNSITVKHRRRRHSNGGGVWSGRFEFVAGGHAAANVAFGLVLLQKGFDLVIQNAIAEGKAFGKVFMYGTFADSEFLRRNPDGGAVLNHVNSQTAGPFLDILLQAATLL